MFRQIVPSVYLLSLLLAGCGGEATSGGMSSTPVSVRGWVGDVKYSGETFAVVDQKVSAAIRRMELLASTNVYVDGVQYASGGVSGNGSFIVLDVPPGEAQLVFQVPTVGEARLVLSGIPGNADVLVPGIVVGANSLTVQDPSRIVIRVPGKQKRPTGSFATVGGHRVPVIETPLSEMVDRRDYPEPPAEKGPVIVR